MNKRVMNATLVRHFVCFLATVNGFYSDRI